MKKQCWLIVLLFFLLINLPLLGALLAGESVVQYCEVPPLTQYVSHAPFSWCIFFLIAILGILVFLLLLVQLRQKQFSTGLKSQIYKQKTFPWWGSLGLLIILISWVVAWNRFPLLRNVQAYTFLPLWLGYILFINGLTYFRCGSCLLVNRTGYFAVLFSISACFWWFFEYLNRFVQNWYYVGVENFSAGEYILHASLCFSTVLPAVLSTEELLSTCSRLTGPLQHSFAFRLHRIRLVSTAILLVSTIGMLGLSLWPDYLFPLLWLSPFLITVTIQKIAGQESVFDCISQGDWRPVWIPALAALFCGFFWELWNVKSYAHWIYSIPFVQKGHIFEMPILGYLGYLPFGLECKALASLVEDILPGGCKEKNIE